MSLEPTSTETTEPREAATAKESPSFGDILRRERTLRGIEIREVALGTRIAPRHLEALEKNDFEALPGGAYTKGFLRAYALYIGLDPEEMVNHYVYEISCRRTAPEPEAPPRAAPSGSWRRTAYLAAIMLAVIAIVAAAFWWFTRGAGTTA
jgi:cytoskeleton protein RodZ